MMLAGLGQGATGNVYVGPGDFGLNPAANVNTPPQPAGVKTTYGVVGTQQEQINSAVAEAQFFAQHGYHIVYTASQSQSPASNAEYSGPYGPGGQAMWIVPNDPNQSPSQTLNDLGNLDSQWQMSSKGTESQINAQCGLFGSLFNQPGCPSAGLGALAIVPVLIGGLLLLFFLTRSS